MRTDADTGSESESKDVPDSGWIPYVPQEPPVRPQNVGEGEMPLDSNPTRNVWVTYSRNLDDGQRRNIRAEAARASSAARQATIAERRFMGGKHGVSGSQTSRNRDSDSRNTRRKVPQPFVSNPVDSTSANAPPARSPANPSQSAQHSPSPSGLSSNFNLVFTADRSRLCTAVLGDDTLWQTVIFVLITDESRVLTANKKAASACAAWLHGEALKCIRHEIHSSNGSNDLLVAIAVIAVWELRYGTVENGNTHFDAWKQIMLQRDVDVAVPEIQRQCCLLADFTLHSILYTYWPPLCLNRDGSPGQHPRASSATQSTVNPPGFHPLVSQCHETYKLISAVDQLANLDMAASQAPPRLRDIVLHIFRWRPPGCPLGDLTAQCIDFVRRVAMGLTFTTIGELSASGHFNPLFDATFADVPAQATANLGIEIFPTMIGTVYQHVFFWSVWIGCSMLPTRTEQVKQSLMRMLCDMECHNYPQLCAILQQFVYSSRLERKSKSLYDSVVGHYSSTT